MKAPGCTHPEGWGPLATFYEVLGVDRKASPEELKRAYRSKARELHPDRYATAAAAERARAETGMRALNEAYDALSVPARRTLYDQCLASGTNFYDALASARPESASEREARQQEDAARAKAVAEAVALVEVGLKRLDPRVRWTRGTETWGYFDMAASCQRGPRRTTLLVKVLPRLEPDELKGIATHAEAMVAQPVQGLVMDQYAYLLVGVELADPARLATEATALNQRFWNGVSGRKPRALVAYGALAAGRPVVPGAQAPEPDLSRLKIPLSLDAVGPTDPPDPAGSVWKDEPTHPPPIDMPKPKPARPLRHAVLLDDDPEMAAPVAAALGPAGWQVHPVFDLAGAKRVLTSLPVSLVLVEPGMAPVPGPLVQWLPGCTVLRRRPKVLLYASRPERERAALCGEMLADGHLAKGGDPVRMLAAVEAASAAFEAEALPGEKRFPGSSG